MKLVIETSLYYDAVSEKHQTHYLPVSIIYWTAIMRMAIYTIL
jgi:hypothetical protein